MIVFHNFFHLVAPQGGENEFSFSEIYLSNFFTNIGSDPINSIQYLFTFFGHYGVQLFVFVSGYGLMKVYGKKIIKFGSFIRKRLIKIYPAFTIAIILLLIYQYVIFDMEFTRRTFASVVIRYTQIANWIPGKIFTLSGPYWFYSMIIQLYLLFPLLVIIQKRFKYGLWTVLLITYALLIGTNDYFNSIELSWYYNFLGNLPVFIIGMLMANSKKLFLPKSLWLISIAVFILSQLNPVLWHLSQVAFVFMTLLPTIWLFHRLKSSLVTRFLLITGHLSMYIFAIHGFLRTPWIGLSDTASSKIYMYLYCAIFLVIVYVVAYIVRVIEHLFMHRGFDIGLDLESLRDIEYGPLAGSDN